MCLRTQIIQSQPEAEVHCLTFLVVNDTDTQKQGQSKQGLTSFFPKEYKQMIFTQIITQEMNAR